VSEIDPEAVFAYAINQGRNFLDLVINDDNDEFSQPILYACQWAQTAYEKTTEAGVAPMYAVANITACVNSALMQLLFQPPPQDES
jgi:hypothetical protein